jgi:hypothetical protein
VGLYDTSTYANVLVHTCMHTRIHTPGSPLIVPWDEAVSGYALLGIKDSQTVSGPATFLRTSEILQWILSVPMLGEPPVNILRLAIQSVYVPGTRD